MTDPDQRKVDFLIAGVQKAGTSALHSFLKQNPSLFMPERKELHFFDTETLNWNDPDYSHYHQNFEAALPNQKIGEATPIYTFWPDALKRIATYNKNIKLIICLRDPVQRAYSAWSMVTWMQKENMSFSKAIREGRERIHDELSRRFYTYVERGFYAEQIETALKLFGPEQLFILWQGQLQSHHNQSLEKISHFLGVKHISIEPQFIRPIQPDKKLPPITDQDRDYLHGLYADDFAKTKKLVEYIDKRRAS